MKVKGSRKPEDVTQRHHDAKSWTGVNCGEERQTQCFSACGSTDSQDLWFNTGQLTFIVSFQTLRFVLFLGTNSIALNYLVTMRTQAASLNFLLSQFISRPKTDFGSFGFVKINSWKFLGSQADESTMEASPPNYPSYTSDLLPMSFPSVPALLSGFLYLYLFPIWWLLIIISFLDISQLLT